MKNFVIARSRAQSEHSDNTYKATDMKWERE